MAVAGTEGARQGRLRGPTVAAAGSSRSAGSRQVLRLQQVQEVVRRCSWFKKSKRKSLQVHTVAAAGTRNRKSTGAHCGCSCFQKSPGGTAAVAGRRSRQELTVAAAGTGRARQGPFRSHCGRCQKKHTKSSGAHCNCSGSKSSGAHCDCSGLKAKRALRSHG